MLALSLSQFNFADSEVDGRKYFTWVDAQGNIHNSPVESSSPKEKPLTTSSDESLAPNDFLTEEEFKNQQEKDAQENPEFFTWVDGSGRVINSVKPEYKVEFQTTEKVADFVMAPPFRLPKKITEGACCSQYSDQFSKLSYSKENSKVEVDGFNTGFETQDQPVPAAYFSITPSESQNRLEFRFYKYDLSSLVEIVALNEDFKPLYLGASIAPIEVPETWSTHGYQELLLEVNDVEVHYLIVFSSNNADASYTVTLRKAE